METGSKLNRDLAKHKILSNCWICEGWTQMKFTYKKTALDDPDDNVFLHLEFESFKAEVMIYDSMAEEYVSVRMVPPGALKYFYTVSGKVVLTQSMHYKQLQKGVKSITDCGQMKEELKEVVVSKTNYYDNIAVSKQLISKNWLSSIKAIPREPLRRIPRKKRVKTPWSLDKSIFKTYVSDNDVLL